MGFDEITNILYLLLQGVGVGIAASITVGPVAVLLHSADAEQEPSFRGSHRGSVWPAPIRSWRSSPCSFSSILQRSIEANRLILSVVSGIIVVIVGVYIFLQNPVTQIRRNRVGKTTLWRDFASMFGITLTNFIYVIPYIMIFFTMFKVSTLGVTDVGSLFGGLLTIAGFLGGAVTWWFALTFLLNLFRHRFSSAPHADGSTMWRESSSPCWVSIPFCRISSMSCQCALTEIRTRRSSSPSTVFHHAANRPSPRPSPAVWDIFSSIRGAMYRAVTLYALEHGAIRSGMGRRGGRRAAAAGHLHRFPLQSRTRSQRHLCRLATASRARSARSR